MPSCRGFTVPPWPCAIPSPIGRHQVCWRNCRCSYSISPYIEGKPSRYQCSADTVAYFRTPCIEQQVECSQFTLSFADGLFDFIECVANVILQFQFNLDSLQNFQHFWYESRLSVEEFQVGVCPATGLKVPLDRGKCRILYGFVVWHDYLVTNVRRIMAPSSRPHIRAPARLDPVALRSRLMCSLNSLARIKSFSFSMSRCTRII